MRIVKQTAALVRGGAVPVVMLLAGLLTSCNQVPVEPHPLVGEGEPPGYIDGQIPDRYKGMRNPFTLQDTAAYAAGAGFYLAYEPSCATCHGTSGRGDGPLVPYLEPRPADFGAPPMLNAFRNNQDYVFWWLAEGVPKTVMPSYRERLNDTQIWQVMIYAWYLGEQAAQHPTTREQQPAQGPRRPPFLRPAEGGAVKP